MSKKGIGRPTRSAEGASSSVVGVRFTPDEIALIKRAAGYEPMSAWLRRMALTAAERAVKR